MTVNLPPRSGQARPVLPVPLGPLPQAEFEAIFTRVPRLTVEVVIVSADGVLLSQRQSPPCQGLWHIPGGTVRFGELLTDAVRRVAAQELGLEVEAGKFLGYIEYPSHLQSSWDWPVGMAFEALPAASSSWSFEPTPALRWFSRLPAEMHEEQRDFLSVHKLTA